MTNQELTLAALNLATFAHKGQTRKFNQDSHLCHLVEVVNILKYVGINDQITLASALLHDVIDDTFLYEELLVQELDLHSGAEDKLTQATKRSIIKVVLELSDNKTTEKARRHSELLSKVNSMSEQALNIKLAVLLSNIMSKPSHWDEYATAKYYRKCEQLISHIEACGSKINQQLLRLALYGLDCQTRGSACYESLCECAAQDALYWSISNNSFVVDSNQPDIEKRGIIIESQLNDLFRCGVLHSFKIANAIPSSLFCSELHSETGDDFVYAKSIEIKHCSKVRPI